VKLLAIETVGRTGSVAALDDDRVVVELTLDAKRRSAQTLAPAIAEVLESAHWQPEDVELVAVAIGPGSFTGLRIGVTTAKTFAYAVGCKIVGVPTLEAIAWRVPRDIAQFSVIIDAERGELFAANFERRADGQPTATSGITIVSANDWLARLAAADVVSGTGLEKLIERLAPGVRSVDRALWAPTAAAVGSAGWRRFLAGERTNVFDLVPQYDRRSAAEERSRG
jgi:tRNA threonylcarbamoyladenosine biosynthesis protein TsaB